MPDDGLTLFVEVKLGNDAMQTAQQASSAIQVALLRQASSMASPLNQHEVGSIRDGYGNTVGKWEVR